MKKLTVIFILVILLTIPVFCASANVVVSNPIAQYTFLNSQEAALLLKNNDDFVMSLSPFDRASRAKSNKEVSADAFLSYVSSQTLDWKQEEISKINTIMDSIRKKFDKFTLVFPDKVYLIKTTGKEEGNAAYCRQNAVILPQSFLAIESEALEGYLIHELFHIYSGNNLDKRESLYNLIGFYRCLELEFPKELANFKITNPDAPKNNYYIEISSQGANVKVVPVLYSEKPFNTSDNKVFFGYLKYKLLVVDINNNKCIPAYKNGKLQLLDEDQSYFSKIGYNTAYTISPEEVLADNFVLMINQNTEVRNPEIIEGMKKIIGVR